MATSSKSSFGALHPAFFMVFIYIIALVFSIFISSAIFHAVNDNKGSTAVKSLPVQEQGSVMAIASK